MEIYQIGTSRPKKHVCGTCSVGFGQRSHLNRHFETKHTDQSTPQAVAKRQKLKDSDKKAKRERTVNNPIMREKLRLKSQAERLAKKVNGANDASAPVATVVDTAPVTATTAVIAQPPASVAIATDPSACVAIESELLTTANVKSFFTPKYEAPRSKEERAANPRPSME